MYNRFRRECTYINRDIPPTSIVHMTIRQFLPVVALPMLLASSLSYAVDNDDDLLEEIPEVLTPVRLKQPRTETPASVTVIEHKLIEASGIRELPELLRLVPGMAVGARSGWDYVVSYHGTSRHNSHRMQVMIDGRSVYSASLATINWDDIPLAMEDIERIEVTRGPNTAAYGANAFLGIINIITKHPDDGAKLRVKATGGNNNTEDYYASTTGQTNTGSYRVSAASRRDSGFDYRQNGTERRDSKNLHFVNGRWLVAPTAEWNLDLQGGYKKGINTDDANGFDITPPDTNVENYFASINSQHFLTANNSLKWQLDHTGARSINEWRTCTSAAALDPDLPSSALVCADVDTNVKTSRTDFDVQETWLSGGNWKLVTGAHAQHQRVYSETLYSGSASRLTYQLFSNVEYRFSPQWLATVAGSHEYLEDGDKEFSPRVALLFLPNENHSVRAVYSEAIRSPDLFETQLRWHYIATNVSTVPTLPITLPQSFELPTLRSPDNLHSEKIRSHELGYYGLWMDRRLQVDVKLYHDDMEDLISDNPAYGSYEPANDAVVEQTGYETEIKFLATENLQMHATYAVIHSKSTTHLEEDLTPRHSGSSAVVYDFGNQWQVSGFYYYANPINKNKFSRADMRLAKQLPIHASRLTLSMTVQHYFQKDADLFDDNLYDQPNRVYLSADLSF